MSFKKQTPTGDVPSPRSHASLARIGSSVYLFGGTHGFEANNDLYVLNTDKMAWTKLAPSGSIPSPRWGHSATAVGEVIYVFGGETVGGKVNDLYCFNPSTLTWSQPSQSGVGVTPRANHSATVHQDRFIIYGGDGVETAEQSLYFLNLKTMEWSIPQQAGEDGAPEPRKGHVTGLHGNRLIVYGGWGTRVNEYLSDVWDFNLNSLTWTRHQRKGAVPEARGGAVGTVFGSLFFVWGGWGAGPHMWNELHYMDVNDFSWLKRKPMGVKIPEERFYLSAVPLKEHSFLLFGGQKADKSCTNELLLLSTGSVY